MFFDIIAGVVLALIIAIAAFLDGYYYGISDNRAEVEHWVERYNQVEEWRAQTSQMLLKSEKRRLELERGIQ